MNPSSDDYPVLNVVAGLLVVPCTLAVVFAYLTFIAFTVAVLGAH